MVRCDRNLSDTLTVAFTRPFDVKSCCNKEPISIASLERIGISSLVYRGPASGRARGLLLERVW